jgi:hypothetical protein
MQIGDLYRWGALSDGSFGFFGKACKNVNGELMYLFNTISGGVKFVNPRATTIVKVGLFKEPDYVNLLFAERPSVTLMDARMWAAVSNKNMTRTFKKASLTELIEWAWLLFYVVDTNRARLEPCLQKWVGLDHRVLLYIMWYLRVHAINASEMTTAIMSPIMIAEPSVVRATDGKRHAQRVPGRGGQVRELYCSSGIPMFNALQSQLIPARSNRHGILGSGSIGLSPALRVDSPSRWAGVLDPIIWETNVDGEPFYTGLNDANVYGGDGKLADAAVWGRHTRAVWANLLQFVESFPFCCTKLVEIGEEIIAADCNKAVALQQAWLIEASQRPGFEELFCALSSDSVMEFWGASVVGKVAEFMLSRPAHAATYRKKIVF